VLLVTFQMNFWTSQKRKELPDRVSDELQSNQISLGPNKEVSLPGKVVL